MHEELRVDGGDQAAEPGLGLPPDLGLPLFVYGLLQPNELAHEHVVGALSAVEPAAVDGAVLRIRDGLPLFCVADHGRVRGSVLWPTDPAESYRRIGAFEPRHHYKWGTVTADVADRRVLTNVLVGRRPRHGTPDEVFEDWRGAMDPTFSHMMGAIDEMVTEHAVPPFPMAPGHSGDMWDRFVRLSATYLVLWSVVERYATLRFGATLEPMARLRAVQGSTDFQAAAGPYVAEPIRAVVDSRNPEKKVGLRTDGSNALTYWYLVRSNLSHRGKSAFRDGELLRTCTLGLHATMRALLESMPGPAES
ncbi:MAG: gamma-glutamylcyclotransferase [Acidimicrobiales bacterium]|nr:gamma-glutamylcyclotransferase [Acidimicrobiales bacterium]